MLGLVALGLAVVGVASLLWLSTLVAAILGGIAVLTGFASLMVGKAEPCRQLLPQWQAF